MRRRRQRRGQQRILPPAARPGNHWPKDSVGRRPACHQTQWPRQRRHAPVQCGTTALLRAIEDNLKDIAGVRVICSFPDDIYKLAESFLKQDDITLIERKDYIKNPKPSGYRSLHLIVQVPIFLQNEKKMVNVEVQFRTIAMDFWASLDHKMRYKKELSDEEVEILQEELYDCARQSAALDERMQGIRDRITKKQEQETILLEDKNSKDWV